MPGRAKLKNEIETIVIDNFTGSLTRAINGPMNSGMAKFYSSWGYNPFSKPRNLTWNVASGTVPITVTGMLLAGKPFFDTGAGKQYIYIITSTANLMRVESQTGIQTLLTTLTMGTPTFNYGASLEFFNGKIWITNDKGLTRTDLDGSNETQVGTWDASHFLQNTFHPLVVFQGKLLVGNTTDGTTTNFGTIDSTNLITTYSTVSPALPVGTFIRDLDITSDFSYLVISAASTPQEEFTPGGDASNASTCDSFRFQWNGSDPGITSGTTLPTFGITALNNFGETEFSFMYDSLGASLYNAGKKVLTLEDNKSPLPNAVTANGNFIVWGAPEIARTIAPATQTVGNAIYYYGQLDAESPLGLWRMMRNVPELPGGSVNELPFLQFATNQYSIVNADGTISPGTAIIIFSTQEFTALTTTYFFRTFFPSVSADLEASSQYCFGVYETQTQLFEKKISPSSIRVYVEELVDNASFKLELIGSDGGVIPNGTFTWTEGTDDPIQGRINFNPNIAPTYALGVRITNLSIDNMTFKKIELDVTQGGK